MNLRDIDPDKLYTVKEARDLIPSSWSGKRPCRNSVYRWILSGKLRGQRYGLGWMVRGSAILDFLQVKEQESKPFEYETLAQERQRGLDAVARMKARWAAEKKRAPFCENPEKVGAFARTVERTLPLLPPEVQAMVRLQDLAALKPGEVVSLRPADIDRKPPAHSGAWVYRTRLSLYELKGIKREVIIGPQGQEVLRPFLDRPPESCCFSPHDVARRRNAERGRPDHKGGKRELPTSFTTESYLRVIARAIDRHNKAEAAKRKPDPIPRWTPDQVYMAAVKRGFLDR